MIGIKYMKIMGLFSTVAAYEILENVINCNINQLFFCCHQTVMKESPDN